MSWPTQTHVAKAAGVTAAAVNQWLRGATTTMAPEAARRLAKSTPFAFDWLLDGTGPKFAAVAEEMAQYAAGRQVPLIPWSRAGSEPWADVASLQDFALRWVPAPKDISRHAYALEVRGDSMYNPSGPKSYPEGCIIIVDPEARSPASGEPVIAALAGEARATFKRYRNEDGQQWLQPLNPAYPRLDAPFRVLGTVVAKLEL